MVVKYAILTIIGDKKQTKTETKHFFEKDSFLCYVRKNQDIILAYRLWNNENQITISCRKELEESKWRIYHPKKKLKKPKEERKEQKNMVMEMGTMKMIIEKELPVVIYLMNGYRLRGNIFCFDDDTVHFKTFDNKQTSIIYKHAISTIEF